MISGYEIDLECLDLVLVVVWRREDRWNELNGMS